MKFERNDETGRYFSDIANCGSHLTKAEELELAEKIKNGDSKALNTLVEANLKFGVHMANKFIGMGLHINDLIQEANLGLIEAAYRFKKEHNCKFITYASNWVRKALNEAIANKARIVRLPLNKEIALYHSKVNGGDLEAPITIKIDTPIGDEDNTTIGDFILRTESNINKQHDIEEINSKIEAALSTLPKRDAEIMRAIYGIGRQFPETPSTIANELNLTETRVNQLIRKSMNSLKEVV